MTFSVGVLYSVQTFLQLVRKTPITASEFRSAFNRYQATNPESVLRIAEICNWISIDIDGRVVITEFGEEILSQKNMIDALRVQLKLIIQYIQPAWAALLPKGRTEAVKYFPPEVYQCFKEAELLEGYDRWIIEWWDQLSSIARGKREDTLLEIGRKGEGLSYLYEQKRTKREVIWQSIESNLSGFDLLSCLNSGSDTPLRIEVKTTNIDTDWVTFYLTSHEWEVAQNSEHYIFHLWVLGRYNFLFVLEKDALLPHIPVSRGNGTWEVLKISLNKKELDPVLIM